MDIIRARAAPLIRFVHTHIRPTLTFVPRLGPSARIPSEFVVVYPAVAVCIGDFTAEDKRARRIDGVH
jgi:hypothetical protein